jgi:UDP-N-acetylglucosamine 2-epimerase (non-hydrolysing)
MTKTPIQISAVVGARPNFMKMAPLLEQIRRRPALTARLIHTGQHYSPEMSEAFFRDLGMPAPDVNLDAGGGTHTTQTAAIMQKLESDFTAHRPGLVLVVGDVNSTMAASLVAAKLGIPLAHVEAGLRSFDRTMPEEINRRVTDVLSNYLFASEPSGLRNLLAEGVPRERVFLTGNVMIDTLLRFREPASRTSILERLRVEEKGYILATLHRPSNVDDPARLAALTGVLRDLARDRMPVVFPVHPRTAARLSDDGAGANVILTPPLGYLEFVRLMEQARLVLTDSGGIQEETTILQVPCLTLRENTERPITLEQGTNRLAGVDPDAIRRAALETLDAPPPAARVPDLWDGRAGERIVDILEKALAG